MEQFVIKLKMWNTSKSIFTDDLQDRDALRCRGNVGQSGSEMWLWML